MRHDSIKIEILYRIWYFHYNLLTAALDSVFGTESEPSIFDNQAFFSKFYMPADEYHAHSCFFLYHELQFWAFKIDLQNLPLLFLLYVKMKKSKNFIKKYIMAPHLCKQLGKNAKIPVMKKYLHPIDSSIKSYKTMSQIIG